MLAFQRNFVTVRRDKNACNTLRMNSPTRGAEVEPSSTRQGRRASNEGRAAFWRACAWAALGIAVVGIAFLVDEPATRWMTLSATSSWQRVANYASKLGEGGIIALSGVVISVLCFLGRRFEAGRGVFLVAATGLITGLGATILRSVVGRTRPDASVPQGFYGVYHDSHWVIGRYEFSSFPSGHTATAIAVAVALWLLYPRIGRFAFLYAGVVGWSRIAMGCHHFSDVMAAVVLGAFGAYHLLKWLEPQLRRWTQGLEHWIASPR